MSLHTLNIAQFRLDFPFFKDETFYTDDDIRASWKGATFLIYPCDNWLISGAKLQYALELMTAHLLYMMLGDGTTVPDGGGTVGGMITSASEGSVSVSMQTPTVSSFDEYLLSQSKWGLLLLALFEGLTVGGFTIGGSPETAAIRDVGGMFSWQSNLKSSSNDCD